MFETECPRASPSSFWDHFMIKIDEKHDADSNLKKNDRDFWGESLKNQKIVKKKFIMLETECPRASPSIFWDEFIMKIDRKNDSDSNLKKNDRDFWRETLKNQKIVKKQFIMF
jgi:hypothetical protein